MVSTESANHKVSMVSGSLFLHTYIHGTVEIAALCCPCITFLFLSILCCQTCLDMNTKSSIIRNSRVILLRFLSNYRKTKIVINSIKTKLSNPSNVWVYLNSFSSCFSYCLKGMVTGTDRRCFKVTQRFIIV